MCNVRLLELGVAKLECLATERWISFMNAFNDGQKVKGMKFFFFMRKTKGVNYGIVANAVTWSLGEEHSLIGCLKLLFHDGEIPELHICSELQRGLTCVVCVNVCCIFVFIFRLLRYMGSLLIKLRAPLSTQ